jgi:hypothetical protein
VVVAAAARGSGLARGACTSWPDLG